MLEICISSEISIFHVHDYLVPCASFDHVVSRRIISHFTKLVYLINVSFVFIFSTLSFNFVVAI